MHLSRQTPTLDFPEDAVHHPVGGCRTDARTVADAIALHILNNRLDNGKLDIRRIVYLNILSSFTGTQTDGSVGIDGEEVRTGIQRGDGLTCRGCVQPK